MTLTRDLHGFLQGLPKIDLHRHLEGSLRLETVVGLAREKGVSLPSYDIERLRPLVQVTDDPPDFDRYLGKFHILRRIYSTRQVIERLAYETVADAAADNVRYLELRFSPSAQADDHLRKACGFAPDPSLATLLVAFDPAEQPTGKP